MGAVDTTYTFTATDTITSTKMNNIIDQTMITTDAIIGNTLEVASGKLKVRAQGITSNEMATGSVTSDAIADGTIVNADINASAAIAGTKISPNFGTQSIVTTGTISTSTNYLSRQQTPDEGGEIQFARALDNATAFTVDCYGSGSSPNLRIFGTTGQVATITAAGNVGIGTSSPSAPLEVKGGSSIDANPDMRVSGSSGYIDIHNSLSGGSYNGIVSSGDKAFIFSNGTSGTGNLVIAPWASGIGGIRIASSGNVGICKSSPTTALDVNGTVTATAFSGPLTGNVTGIASGNIKQGGGSNQLSNVVFIGWSGSSQLRVQVDATDFGANWPINITGKASTLSNGGGTGNAMTFEYNGQAGTPLYVWGSNNTSGGTNNYVYSPANFSVNYANSAGSATTATTATTVSNGAITAAKLNGAQGGNAPIYGVRAFVQFEGRNTNGSCTIRASGNVTSVARTAVGKYTVTFGTPMQSLYYAVTCSASSSNVARIACADRATATLSSIEIETYNAAGGADDFTENSVMIIE